MLIVKTYKKIYTAIRESGPDERLFVFAVRGFIEAKGKPPTNCYRAVNIKVRKKR